MVEGVPKIKHCCFCIDLKIACIVLSIVEFLLCLIPFGFDIRFLSVEPHFSNDNCK